LALLQKVYYGKENVPFGTNLLNDFQAFEKLFYFCFFLKKKKGKDFPVFLKMVSKLASWDQKRIDFISSGIKKTPKKIRI